MMLLFSPGKRCPCPCSDAVLCSCEEALVGIMVCVGLFRGPGGGGGGGPGPDVRWQDALVILAALDRQNAEDPSVVSVGISERSLRRGLVRAA